MTAHYNIMNTFPDARTYGINAVNVGKSLLLSFYVDTRHVLVMRLMHYA